MPAKALILRAVCMADYKGQPCQCAGCWHVDGVCIDHESGSGCAACEGPVSECDTSVQGEEE